MGKGKYIVVAILVFLGAIFMFFKFEDKGGINISKSDNLEILTIYDNSDIKQLEDIYSKAVFNTNSSDRDLDEGIKYKFWYADKKDREINIALYIFDEEIILHDMQRNLYATLEEEEYITLLAILNEYKLV